MAARVSRERDQKHIFQARGERTWQSGDVRHGAAEILAPGTKCSERRAGASFYVSLERTPILRAAFCGAAFLRAEQPFLERHLSAARQSGAGVRSALLQAAAICDGLLIRDVPGVLLKGSGPGDTYTLVGVQRQRQFWCNVVQAGLPIASARAFRRACSVLTDLCAPCALAGVTLTSCMHEAGRTLAVRGCRVLNIWVQPVRGSAGCGQQF